MMREPHYTAMNINPSTHVTTFTGSDPGSSGFPLCAAHIRRGGKKHEGN